MPTLYLNGIERGWKRGSLSVQEAVGERSSLTFTIPDVAETLTVPKGTPVTFVDTDGTDDVIVFSGVVESSKRRVIVNPDGGGINVEVTCVDNHHYPDKRIVTQGFEAVTAGDVIKSLISFPLREENIYDHPFPGHLVAQSRTNLLGYWRLGGDALDDSYRSEDGTEVGTATYVTTAGASPVGDDNLGGYLDNTTGQIDTTLVPSEINGPYVANDGMTFGGWVYKNGTGFNFDYAMFAGDNSTLSNNDYSFAMRWSGGTAGDGIEVAISNQGGGSGLFTATDATFPTDEWHHVVGVVDETGGDVVLRLYVDGVEVTTSTRASGSPKFNSQTGEVVLGGDETNSNTWRGRLSEMFVTGRPMTADEIADIYAQAGETSRVADGPTLEEVVISYVTASKAIEELADTSALDWYIDPYRTLHFHARGATCCAAPFTVTQDKMLSGSVDLAESAPKYRNRQFVQGGRDETASLEEVVTADGEQRTFATGFPISRVPSVEVEDDVGAGTYTPQTMGIKGIDDGSVQFLWAKGDALVTQDSSQTIVPNGRRVRITYVGQFPIVVVTADQAEVVTVRNIEKAGTGRIESVLDDTDVNSRQQGFDVATGLLDKFATRGQTVRFVTRDPGLKAGQIATVDLPRFGLSSVEVLLDQVESFDLDGIEMRYSVQGVTGPTLLSWRQFFATTAKRAQVVVDRVNVGQEEVATQLVSVSETHTQGEVSDETVAACVLLSDPGPTLPFTLC